MQDRTHGRLGRPARSIIDFQSYSEPRCGVDGNMDALRAHFDHELSGVHFHHLGVEAGGAANKPRVRNHGLEDTADGFFPPLGLPRWRAKLLLSTAPRSSRKCLVL